MKKLTAEEILKLDIAESTKAFVTDQQNKIHFLKRDLDAAQKACAEMRGIIMQFSPANERWQNMINHALSTDCGKGFFAVSELDPAIAWLRESVEELKWAEVGPLLVLKIKEEIKRLTALMEGK